MLLSLTWLIPGIPIISSFLLAALLLSFNKTMNRLTKPVSYFLIIGLILSEIINFIFYKKEISGIDQLFGGSLNLFVDRPAILFGEYLGLFFLLLMIFSVSRLKRRNGYVRYFIVLGFLSGFLYLFSFSGSLFHGFYDPLISSLIEKGISF